MADNERWNNFQSPKSDCNPGRAAFGMAAAASVARADAALSAEVTRCRVRRADECSFADFRFGRVATDCGRLAQGDSEFAVPMFWGQLPNHETGQEAATL